MCDTKQIIVSERDGETSLAYSVPLKSFEFKFQRAQQSMKLNVILRLLQVIIIIIPLVFLYLQIIYIVLNIYIFSQFLGNVQIGL